MNSLRLYGFVVFAFTSLHATHAGDILGIRFTVSNAGGQRTHLFAGVAQAATVGIDPLFGETELPPLPPGTGFDVRFASISGGAQLGAGSATDIRPILSVTDPFRVDYLLQYRSGNNASWIRMVWDSTFRTRIRRIRIDGQEMTSNGSYQIAGNQGSVVISIDYNCTPLSFTAEPARLDFSAGNLDSLLPSKALSVRVHGDSLAHWSIFSPVEWIRVTPAAGNGDAVVQVSIASRMLAAGEHDTVLTVSSSVEPAMLEVPVTLHMTVGLDVDPAIPVEEAWLNPVPASGACTLSLRTLKVQHMTVSIHDPAGRFNRIVLDRVLLEPGLHHVPLVLFKWLLAPGVYFVHVQNEESLRVVKLLYTGS